MSQIFITGGLGDCIAIDSFWSPEEKSSVETIHWGTRCGRQMMPIFAQFPEYSSLKAQIDHWDYEQRKILAFHHTAAARQNGVELPAGVIDRSIWWEFDRHRRENTQYQGSSLIANKLADVGHLALPEKYAVVVHNTPVNLDPIHRQIRGYQPQDWEATLRRLEYLGLPGVLVNMPSDDPIPDDPRLIDLRGQTSLEESIEVVKGCSHYVGIDSWASIVAAMVHEDKDRLRVLSRNPHLYHHLRSYYPTHEEWTFVGKEIRP